MSQPLKRLSFFSLGIIVGALAFGAFWSSTVQARTTANGPWCSQNSNATMCYNGVTYPSVPPSTQTSYLLSGKGSCGACGTSPN